MKTSKIFLSSMLVLGMFAISAAPATNTKVQCGVSNNQIIDYLKNCSHHHTYACCVVDIPGSCNSKATIENCGTATVYVNNGIVIGHMDSSGICGDGPDGE